jgi:hypothetical protein
LAWLSRLPVSAMRGRASGPMSSDIPACVLSLASPPVRWRSRGLAPRPIPRWISAENHRAHGRTPSDTASFAPAAERWCCAVEKLDQVCRLVVFRQKLEECLARLDWAAPNTSVTINTWRRPLSPASPPPCEAILESVSNNRKAPLLRRLIRMICLARGTPTPMNQEFLLLRPSSEMDSDAGHAVASPSRCRG